MKKLCTLFFALVLFTSLHAQVNPQLSNPGFEKWEAVTPFPTTPTGFINNDIYTGKTTITKSTKKRSGSFAMSIVPDTTMDLFPFLISISVFEIGTVDYKALDTYSGTPFAGRPSKLSYWGRRDTVGNKVIEKTDTAGVQLILTLSKYNKTTKKSESIGSFDNSVLFDKSFEFTYKEVVIPIKYVNNNIPDTLGIFGLCVYNKLKRSPIRMLIDDMSFVYPVGTNDLAANNIRVYPIPAMEFVTLEPSNLPEAAQITLYDINGRQVLNQQIDGDKFRLELSNFTNGIYIYHISDKEGKVLIASKLDVVK